MKLKTALKKQSEWSARGSLCPICHNEFSSSECTHSVNEAHERLAHNVMRATIRKELKRIGILNG